MLTHLQSTLPLSLCSTASRVPDASPSPMSLLFTPLAAQPTPTAAAAPPTAVEPVKFSLADFLAGSGGKKHRKASRNPSVAAPQAPTPVWGGFSPQQGAEGPLNTQAQQQTSLRTIQVRIGSVGRPRSCFCCLPLLLRYSIQWVDGEAALFLRCLSAQKIQRYCLPLTPKCSFFAPFLHTG